MCSHLNSSSLACSCFTSGHSSRPWRFNSSRIHPLQGMWMDSPGISIGRTTGTTWLARVTLPTIALVGTLMEWAFRFLTQIGTWEEPRCNSPYVAVGTTEVGNWGPQAGAATMWTCMHCPQMPVLPCMLMVSNGRMVTPSSGMERFLDIIQKEFSGCCMVRPLGGSDPLPHFPIPL